MDLSIIIPSYRETHRGETIDRTISMFHTHLSLTTVRYEIIVVSPWRPADSRGIIYLYEDSRSPLGCLAAFNRAYPYARGKYILPFFDEVTLYGEWWRCMEFIDDMDSQRKYRIVSLLSRPFPPTELPMVYCARKDTIDTLFSRRLYNPALYHNYADNDIGCRLYTEGEPTVTFPGPIPHCGNITEGANTKKLDWFRLDGMVFNAMWGNRGISWNNLPRGDQVLYKESPHTDEELGLMLLDRLKRNIWRQKE